MDEYHRSLKEHEGEEEEEGGDDFDVGKFAMFVKSKGAEGEEDHHEEEEGYWGEEGEEEAAEDEFDVDKFAKFATMQKK